MKLSIGHRTIYRYGAPRKRVLQSHRLTPSAFDGQSVVDWNVAVEGGLFGAEFRDGAGDMTTTVSIAGPLEEVAISVNGVVETHNMSGVLRGFRERVPPMVYLRTTRTTRLDLALTELAQQAVAGIPEANVLERAHAVSRAVSEALTFEAGTTKAHTTASEALAQGRGVCQDYAHVLIAAAQSLSVPARYVAGYLAGGSHMEQGVSGEAAHAWAELHVEGLGWVGFDAANECCPDEHYVRLCSGLDAADAAPIRGLALGDGAEEALEVSVAIQPVQQ